jgi:hypothetical protein
MGCIVSWFRWRQVSHSCKLAQQKNNAPLVLQENPDRRQDVDNDDGGDYGKGRIYDFPLLSSQDVDSHSQRGHRAC